MEDGQAIPALAQSSRIKRALRKHLKSLGFGRESDGSLSLPSTGKQAFRDCHGAQRTEKNDKNDAFLNKTWPLCREYFASGSEINPQLIRPALELVEAGTWQSELFRLATLTWSVPVSGGYGRRMRFLVWDKSNGKLMGLIGLTDPVFNLRVRDQDIGWTGADRKERLACMMDAHILGAIPPYNQLLCGKLISCLIRSKEIRDLFHKKYGSSVGIISGKAKKAKLIAVTTSSSLGKSSVYNRLKLDGSIYFKPLGYTEGFGHFQVPQQLFEEMRRYLESINHPYANRNEIGNGPNWRLRAIRKCLEDIGFNANILQHNLKREVFISPLASNYKEILQGTKIRPSWNRLLRISEISQQAVARWVLPRSETRPEWRVWNKDNILAQIRGFEAPNKGELKNGTGI